MPAQRCPVGAELAALRGLALPAGQAARWGAKGWKALPQRLRVLALYCGTLVCMFKPSEEDTVMLGDLKPPEHQTQPIKEL